MNCNAPQIEDLNKSNCTERSIKIHYPEFYNDICEKTPQELKWTEKLYWVYYKLTDYPKCPVCGKPPKFINLKIGYSKYCSSKCSNSSPEKIKLQHKTTFIHYGVLNPSQSDVIKDKIKHTNLERRGVEYASQSEAIKNKVKLTNLERYGVEYALQSQEFQNKVKQTCLERYGVECSLQSKEIQNKVKLTNLERYGVEHALQSEAIKNKVKQTNLERYGVEHVSQLGAVKNKVKQSCLERHGVENPFQSDVIRDKIKQTNLKKYGAENPFQSNVIKDKIKQTNLEKYGAEHYTQSKEYQSIRGEIQNKFKQTNLEKYGVEHYTQSQEFQNRHDEIQNKANDTKRQNHTFNTSRIEKDFELYLTSHNIEYKTQYRSELYPFNCDFYIPEYDLYIEIQAGWFHGHHPYDPKSDEKTLKIWKTKNTKYYDNAIEIWTVRDVNKRNAAKRNNLNYLEIFSNNINEVTSRVEEYIKKEEP